MDGLRTSGDAFDSYYFELGGTHMDDYCAFILIFYLFHPKLNSKHRFLYASTKQRFTFSNSSLGGTVHNTERPL